MKGNKEERESLLKHLGRENLKLLVEYLEIYIEQGTQDLINALDVNEIKQLQGRVKSDRTKVNEIKALIYG